MSSLIFNNLKKERVIHSPNTMTSATTSPVINSFFYQYQDHHHHHHHPHEHHHAHENISQVLDLSRRRDSVETRKTPSPYTNSSHDESSPSTRRDSSEHLPANNGPVSNLLHPSHHLLFTPPTLAHARFYCSQQRTPSPSEISLYSQAESSHHRQEPITKFNGYEEGKSDALEQDHHASDDSSDMIFKSHTSIDQQPPSAYPMIVGRDGKLARPFKAYPRNPMTIAASFTATDNASAEKYSLFRKRMLDQIHAANGGQPTVSNPKMRRTIVKAPGATLSSSYSDSESKTDDNRKMDDGSSCGSGREDLGSSSKDVAYMERRKKNNAAAKKSRDRRRIKEDEIAIRAAYLERENIELKFELAAIRKQLGVPVSP